MINIIASLEGGPRNQTSEYVHECLIKYRWHYSMDGGNQTIKKQGR